MVRNRLWIAAVLSLGAATPAFPCSVMRPPPTPEALVARATVIVHARAEGLVDRQGTADSILARTHRQVRFRALAVLKGTLEGDALTFNGSIEDWDDWNDRPVPYDFIRRGGRRGNCFALGYRIGAEYLLMLARPARETTPPASLSPYWAPLSPTNEQVRGATDPWLAWVAKQAARK